MNNAPKLAKGDFQKIVDHIKTLSTGTGEPISSDTDLTARCENLTYLKDLKEIAEVITRELTEMCEKETKEVEFFVEQQEQRLTSIKDALRGQKHVPVSIPATPSAPREPMITVPTALVTSNEKKLENPWEVVGRKGRAQNLVYQDIATPAHNPDATARNNGYTFVTQQVGKTSGYVRAIEVDNVDDCVRFPNRLCWSKNKLVFCFSFDGVPRPLVSKIPRIYPANETPQKFYNHKFLRKGETVNPDDHTFYVPVENTEHADHWCFTDRARYLPASYKPGRSDAYVYRIGDYDNFAEDMANLGEDSHEYILFRNMASGFWITLCAIENELKRRRQFTRK